MKVRVITFKDESNGLDIQVTAETEAEQAIVRAAYKHGVVGSGHGPGVHGDSLCISIFSTNKKKENENV